MHVASTYKVACYPLCDKLDELKIHLLGNGLWSCTFNNECDSMQLSFIYRNVLMSTITEKWRLHVVWISTICGQFDEILYLSVMVHWIRVLWSNTKPEIHYFIKPALDGSIPGGVTQGNVLSRHCSITWVQ